MSAFPSLPGLKIDVERSTLFDTEVKSSRSGKEQRATFASLPRYRYRLNFEFLRANGPTNEVDSLLSFFAARKGRFDSFDYVDPIDGTTRTVRFDSDEVRVQRLFAQVWSGSVDLISVL